MGYTKGQKLTLEQVRALSPYYADVEGYMPNGKFGADHFQEYRYQPEDTGPMAYGFYTPDGTFLNIGQKPNGGFSVQDVQNFKSDADYLKWANKNNKDSDFDSFMFKAIPAVVLAAFGGGALNAMGAGAAGSSGGLLGSGTIEGAAGVTEGLGASMAANGAAVANSTLAALPEAAFTIGEGLAAGAGGGGLLASGSGGGGFTLDAAMLDPSNAASGLAELTQAGTQAAAGDMAATAGAFESGLGNLPNQSIWDSATDWMKENPKTTYDIARTGIGLLAGSQVKNQGGSSVNTSTAFTPFTPNQFQYAPIVPEWAKKGLL